MLAQFIFVNVSYILEAPTRSQYKSFLGQQCDSLRILCVYVLVINAVLEVVFLQQAIFDRNCSIGRIHCYCRILVA